MAHCFCLIRDNKAIPLAQVDEEICAHFGVVPHETRYYKGWFDIEGFGFALGLTRERQLEINPERAEIINFLYDNYQIDSWRS